MGTGLDVAKLLEGLDIQTHMDLVYAKLNKAIGTLFLHLAGRCCR